MNYHADTIIIGILALIVIWRIFSCKHYWDLVDKTEMESRLETILKSTKGFQYLFSSEVTNAAYKRLVLVLRCTKCGQSKIRKIDSA